MHELSVTQGLLKICLEEGGKNNYLCPSCKGNKYEIIKGREFYLDTMEVE